MQTGHKGSVFLPTGQLSYIYFRHNTMKIYKLAQYNHIMPWAIIARATLRNAAVFAPRT